MDNRVIVRLGDIKRATCVLCTLVITVNNNLVAFCFYTRFGVLYKFYFEKKNILGYSMINLTNQEGLDNLFHKKPIFFSLFAWIKKCSVVCCFFIWLHSEIECG